MRNISCGTTGQLKKRQQLIIASRKEQTVTMAGYVEAMSHADGPLLCKSEIELKETEDNKRKALEQLTKYLVKNTKQSKQTYLLQ